MICDQEEVALGKPLTTNQKPSDRVMLSYLIMPRFGRNLETYFENQNRVLSKASIFHLGRACIDLLEQIHNAGYVYNDLKLDNLLLDFKQSLPARPSIYENCFADVTINLVDYGFTTKYLMREPGCTQLKHIEKKEVETFRGNMIFSSSNQLRFFNTSRRDDLVSLCYLMIYLVR